MLSASLPTWEERGGEVRGSREEGRGGAPHLTEVDSHGTAPDLAAPAAAALAAPDAATLAASLPFPPPLRICRVRELGEAAGRDEGEPALELAGERSR